MWQCDLAHDNRSDGQYYVIMGRCVFISTLSGVNWFQARINCLELQGDLLAFRKFCFQIADAKITIL